MDQQQEESAVEMCHVEATCDDGIIITNTGIKQGSFEPEKQNGRVKKFEKTPKARMSPKRVKRAKQDRVTAARHFSRASVVVEAVGPFAARCALDVQSASKSDLESSIFYIPPLSALPQLANMPRDKMLQQRKIQLRHRIEQFKGAQRFRTTERSQLRFSETLKLLKRLDRAKEEM